MKLGHEIDGVIHLAISVRELRAKALELTNRSVRKVIRQILDQCNGTDQRAFMVVY